MSAAWALTALPLATLMMTLVNLATWRRGRRSARFEGTVSVLVPARNEAGRIGDCLASISATAHPIEEILVYDDESTDETRDVVAAHAARDPRVRLVATEPLPDGWVGKAHACDRLARAAIGDVLVFVDADVRLLPDGLARLASILEVGRCAVLTAVPRQEMRSFTERLLLPLLLITYLSWLPLELVARSRDPRVVAANGQIMAMRRAALERLGHFRCVASEVVDDVALCRAAKAAGLRVAFADGFHMAVCRMYPSGPALWAGFSKNIAEGVGGARGVVLVIAMYLAAFLGPWVVLAGATVMTGLVELQAPALCGVLANVAQRLLVAVRYRQPVESVALHPVAIAALVVLALRSLSWSARGRIAWSGRVYGARSARRIAA